MFLLILIDKLAIYNNIESNWKSFLVMTWKLDVLLYVVGDNQTYELRLSINITVHGLLISCWPADLVWDLLQVFIPIAEMLS